MDAPCMPCFPVRCPDATRTSRVRFRSAKISKFFRHSAAVCAEVDVVLLTTSADPIRWCSNFQPNSVLVPRAIGGIRGGVGYQGSDAWSESLCVMCVVSSDAFLLPHPHPEVGRCQRSPVGRSALRWMCTLCGWINNFWDSGAAGPGAKVPSAKDAETQ